MPLPRPLFLSCLPLLLCLCLGVALAVLPVAVAQTCACPDPPLADGEPVYIAVLVYGQTPEQPMGLWDEQHFMSQSPFPTTPSGEWAGPPTVDSFDPNNLGFVLFNSYYQGIGMWTRPMKERASPNLPFPGGGGANLRVRFINLGSADWKQTMGWAVSHNVSLYDNLDFATGQLNPNGQLYKLTDDSRHADFGASRPFTFIIIPPYFPDALAIALANRVEDSRSKILIHTFGGTAEPFVCGDPRFSLDYGAEAGLDTPDCDARGRLPGQRRFHTMFNMLTGQNLQAASTLELYYTLGLKRVAIFNAGPSPGDNFPFHASRYAKINAESVNIQAVVYQTDVACPSQDAPCTHTWPDGKSSMDVARECKEQEIEGVIMIGHPGSSNADLLNEVLVSFHALDYTPKNLYFSGGIEELLGAKQPFPDGLDFALVSTPWVPQLKGPNYQSFNSNINFELYPAEEGGRDSPAVWQDEYLAIGNPYAIQPVMGMLGYASLNVAQKMVELSRSRHVPTLLATAAAMAEPSPFGLINFDQTGQRARNPEVLVQRGRLADGADGFYPTKVAYPFNIGAPIEYPMPTWKERIAADPMQYNDFSREHQTYDNAILAVNSVVLLCALVVLGLIFHFRSTSVIRSSTPWFCMLNVLGIILMLLGNYLTLTTVNDAMCAGQVWLLTLGFSITFGSLFFKTFRIWRIFGGKKLRVMKMKDTELLLYLGLFVAADLIINSVWQGAYGMPSKLVVPDRLRPALNYNECSYSDEALGFLYTHLALKGTLLFFGILLGYAVRNTPSAFNEATFIALSIYNVSLTSAFVIPILTSGLGGRVTVLSIRAYAVMFISLTTLAILFVPKFMKIFSKDRLSALDGGASMGTQIVSSKNNTAPGSKGGGGGPGSPTPMSPGGPSSKPQGARPSMLKQASDRGSVYRVSTMIGDSLRPGERTPVVALHPADGLEEEREQLREPTGDIPSSSRAPDTSEEPTQVQPEQPQLPGAANED